MMAAPINSSIFIRTVFVLFLQGDQHKEIIDEIIFVHFMFHPIATLRSQRRAGGRGGRPAAPRRGLDSPFGGTPVTRVPHLLAVGGAHIDRRGKLHGAHVPGVSNPGAMREDVGGGAYNAARVAACRGVSVSLMSVRGGDQAGGRVAESIRQAGMEDLSITFLDRATPSYTAILDDRGELVTGLADTGLYDLAFAGQLRRRACRDAVAAADAILCDANMPAAALDRLAALAGGKPVFAIAVSPAKTGRLAGILPVLSCLFMNAREARSLTGAAADAPLPAVVEALAGLGLKRGIVTAGGETVIAFDGDGPVGLVPPPARQIADVTGAGDALAGAAAAALLRGADLAQALREGAAAALLAVESEAAATHLTAEALEAALSLVPEPHPVR